MVLVRSWAFLGGWRDSPREPPNLRLRGSIPGRLARPPRIARRLNVPRSGLSSVERACWRGMLLPHGKSSWVT